MDREENYTYDSFGNVLSCEEVPGNNANDKITTYATYDMLGRMITSTDDKGNTTEYTYNALGIVTNKKVPFNVVNDEEIIYTNYSYSYDNVGNVTRENVTSGVSNIYTYDYRNRLTQASPGSQTIKYAYDDAVNMIQYNIANCTQVHKYVYDGLSRLLSVSSEGDSTTKFTANYTYDSNSNITKAADNNCTRTYTYNNANMLTVINNDGSGSLDTKYTYEYNYDGNVKKVTDVSGNQTIYGYDTNNRLIEETYLRVNGSTDEIFYSYDAFGNRSKLEYNCDREYVVNYIYDKNNRLINEEKLIYGSNKHYEIIDYSYDKNGNQISKAKYNQNIENKFTVSINDVNTDDSVGYEVFTYDRLNELTSYKNSKGTTATYSYLPNHYRMSKTVDGVLTQQIWDGENIVAEANDANAILRSYTWGNQLLTYEKLTGTVGGSSATTLKNMLTSSIEK